MADIAKYQEIVEAVDAQILALISGGAISNYAIAGRSIAKFSMTELRSARDYYQGKIDSAMYGNGITYAHMGD